MATSFFTASVPIILLKNKRNMSFERGKKNMARLVTVFTVSQFNGETMEETLVFSSYEKAHLDMKNEYLNHLDLFKEASVTVVEHYIDDTTAMIRTEEGKEVWNLEEVVVDGYMEEHKEHRNFHATITVPKKIADCIRKAMCWKEGDPERCRMGEEETIRYTATFENGYQMDIKCCGVKYEPPVSGDDNLFLHNAAWAEAVLYNASGEEVACSEAGNPFFGTWTLSDERNGYTAEVITGNKKSSMSKQKELPNATSKKYIDLYTAFQLTGISNDEIIRLRDANDKSKANHWLMTGRQVRERYDMRRTKVVKILPYISVSDGNFEGFLFTVTDSNKGENG